MATRVKSPVAVDDYFELVKRFPLIPIRNDRHLREAHKMIDELAIIGEDDLTEGQAAYLEVLSDLSSKYESPAFDQLTKGVTGLDVLKHLMEENDLSGSDIGRIIGQRELGAKVLKGDRLISREHARLLGQHFGLPAEIFMRD